MASQEDLRQLVGLLTNSLEANKEIRENAEKILIETAEKNTSVMVQLLLEIIKGRFLSNLQPQTHQLASRRSSAFGCRRL